MKRPTITILSKHDLRARMGHPWIYSNEIQMDKQATAIPPGSVVNLRTERGEALGLASFNPHTLIAARRLDKQDDATIDAAWFQAKFTAAKALRDRFFDKPFYRLVHAEADGLGGLIVDLYGDVVVLQANTAFMDQSLPDIITALKAVTGAKTFVHNRSGAAITHEGLSETSSLLGGQLSGPLEIQENGARFFVDPIDGQKTGWFYDQRANRAFAAALSKGRTVLDAYCYAGGFGVLAATQGATHVTLLDRSDMALNLARKAAAAGGVEGICHFEKADALSHLEKLVAEGKTFDVVIADPPAFIKNRKDVAAGLKGYRKLAKLAASLVAPQGILCLGSCSHHAEVTAWQEQNARGLTDAKRTGRILYTAGAGPDHPVHPLLPESAYLKFEAFQLD